MPAIEARIEVSECTVTPKAYAADTAHPWVSIDFTPVIGDANVVEVSLQVTGPDDLERIIAACEEAHSHFDRLAVPERRVSEVRAAVREMLR